MKNPTDKIIAYFLSFIWLVLLLFATLTLVSPLWLEKLSKPGKIVEAVTKKDYGDRFLDRGNYRQAIIQYRAALEIKPDMNSALSNMASAYYELGDLKNAARIYNHLLKKDPEHPDVVHANLAEVYETIGDEDLAIKHYEKAAALAPDPVSAYQKAGKLHMDKGNFTRAIDDFLAAIDHRKNIENAYRAMLKRELQKTENDEAKRRRFDSLLIDRAYLPDLKKYDAQIFEKELMKDVALAKTYNNLGYCRYMLGDPGAALENFETALQIYPGLTDAANNRRILMNMLRDENSDGEN